MACIWYYNAFMTDKLDAIACHHCGVAFVPTRRWNIFCSLKCSQLRNREHSGYRALSRELDIAPGTVGAINELRVAIDLLKRGFDVYRALSPASPCDLVIFKNGSMLRIEVKTGYIRTGLTESSLFVAPPKRDDSFDILAIVLPEEILYQPELP